MRRLLFLLQTFAATVIASAQPARTELVLKSDWKFIRADEVRFAEAGYDDSDWQSVTVPHDWAISGPFDNNNDKQTVAIEQNGESVATEKTGRTGSLPWTGIGWYRCHFAVSAGAARVILNFDGAMAEPEVYVNGTKAGEWKYGYNAFNIDVTPYVNKGGAQNVLAVRLRNLPESSRWYPGAGLFRPVTLIQTARKAVDMWGVDMRTLSIQQSQRTAQVSVDVSLLGCDESDRVQIEFCGSRAEVGVRAGKAHADLSLAKVSFWSPEHPQLYPLRVKVMDAQGRVTDDVTRRVGIRTISYTAACGFQLNNETRKFRGVCLHHDLGMIGAAVNKAALVRQVELLKAMGCDAIRTSHNMPSQWQMDVCDSLGMLVMAESFDMWVYPKCKNGYNRFYNEWWQRDLENLILANRLHPSIVMWSLGNEIPEQTNRKGTQMMLAMQDMVHNLDPSRPCTAGLDRWDDVIESGFADGIDIVGLNYRTTRYQTAYNRLHQKFVLGSETASTISSRGVYKFPVVRVNDKTYPDGQCCSYDLEACRWSNIPEDDWVLQDDNDWVIGEFVWTGFDYLGEPTPYDDRVNARSSYFGIFDLAGLPKDRYWLYRSRWNKDAETIHLLPHWTWPGREGELTPVYCYTNYPTAELFVNGKSQGRISKCLDVRANPDGSRIASETDPLIDRYRLRWNNVKYEPGEVRVVVYDADGKRRGESVCRTAGAPYRLTVTQQSLDEYRGHKTLRADGEDMAFYVVQAVDKDGNLCPEADCQVNVQVSGAADFKGLCNGDATSFEVFTRPTMKLFKGQLVVGIISNGKKGTARISVESSGLLPASARIKAK
ncbi:MAG: DUF4982 domain-containing protein [Bacteroidaceae bacterium]|nr:DUF4982 domain-containing protein [Bacteroidaceae bacterium]